MVIISINWLLRSKTLILFFCVFYLFPPDFVGADLAGLVRSASSFALDRVYNSKISADLLPVAALGERDTGDGEASSNQLLADFGSITVDDVKVKINI